MVKWYLVSDKYTNPEKEGVKKSVKTVHKRTQESRIHLFGFGQVNIIRMFTVARRTISVPHRAPSRTAADYYRGYKLNSKCNYLCINVCFFRFDCVPKKKKIHGHLLEKRRENE